MQGEKLGKNTKEEWTAWAAKGASPVLNEAGGCTCLIDCRGQMSVSSPPCVCEECRCSLPNLKQGQPACGRPVGSVRAWQSGHGCWVDRGAMTVLQECPDVNMERKSCASCTADLLSLPGATCTCVSCEPRVWVQVKAVASM